MTVVTINPPWVTCKLIENITEHFINTSKLIHCLQNGWQRQDSIIILKVCPVLGWGSNREEGLWVGLEGHWALLDPSEGQNGAVVSSRGASLTHHRQKCCWAEADSWEGAEELQWINWGQSSILLSIIEKKKRFYIYKKSILSILDQMWKW